MAITIELPPQGGFDGIPRQNIEGEVSRSVTELRSHVPLRPAASHFLTMSALEVPDGLWAELHDVADEAYYSDPRNNAVADPGDDPDDFRDRWHSPDSWLTLATDSHAKQVTGYIAGSEGFSEVPTGSPGVGRVTSALAIAEIALRPDKPDQMAQTARDMLRMLGESSLGAHQLVSRLPVEDDHPLAQMVRARNMTQHGRPKGSRLRARSPLRRPLGW